MNFEKEKLIKSPLNYTGGKFKLLPQILPLFPENINTFIDLFSGGCNIGINVKANKIICNDILTSVVHLMDELKKVDRDTALKSIDKIIDEYKLSKTNEEGYKRLREDYNLGKREWDMFYTMICYSFNNQIRFNKNNEFNMPFGKNRSSFNDSLRDKFKLFVEKLNKINIEFMNKDFKEISIENLNNNDFIYCDPPYLITCASYNENNGWNQNREVELLNYLDRANERGIKFALSNVLENKGKSNDILKEWAKKYNIHYLNNTYKNCSYHTKDRSNNSTIEVLVTNY